MNGLVKDGIMDAGPQEDNTAVRELRRAVELLEEARITFADVPPHIRGRTLEVSFFSFSTERENKRIRQIFVLTLDRLRFCEASKFVWR